MPQNNRVYMRKMEKERRKEYGVLSKEDLIEKLLDMEEDLIDAHYESMEEDL